MKERKFKPCLTKQLLNMFKLWCESGSRLGNVEYAEIFGGKHVPVKQPITEQTVWGNKSYATCSTCKCNTINSIKTASSVKIKNSLKQT